MCYTVMVSLCAARIGTYSFSINVFPPLSYRKVVLIQMNNCLEIIQKAIDQFKITGTPRGCLPHGNGHINDTFCLFCDEDDGSESKYIIQSVNGKVFKKPVEVMNNIARITEHLKPKTTDPRGVLNLMKTKQNNNYYLDDMGNCWRMYRFIDHSICIERPERTDDFYESGYAFGKFQRDLADFPIETLFETIPHFHDTPMRYRVFLEAVETDPLGRVAEVRDEIRFVKERADFCYVLEEAHQKGELPLRVSHNDTKCNNALLDERTRKALCVIDLDTIMPGYSVTDFGDAIRFGASTAEEDEKDLSKVGFDIGLFTAFADGFLTGSGGQLLNSEIMLMPEGAKMMTLECGIRFLTDYLQGDTYFKIKYAKHNLVRCRTQLKLVQDMESYWDTMKQIVSKYCK